MTQTNYSWKGKKFLIADDDPYSYLLLDKVLKKTGATVVFACDGKEALAKLTEDESISVAILDIVMPKMNGCEVVEKAKKIRPDIVFIAYTADIVNFRPDNCSKYGFNMCITKPVLPVKFLRLLDEALMLRSQLL